MGSKYQSQPWNERGNGCTMIHMMLQHSLTMNPKSSTKGMDGEKERTWSGKGMRTDAEKGGEGGGMKK